MNQIMWAHVCLLYGSRYDARPIVNVMDVVRAPSLPDGIPDWMGVASRAKSSELGFDFLKSPVYHSIWQTFWQVQITCEHSSRPSSSSCRSASTQHIIKSRKKSFGDCYSLTGTEWRRGLMYNTFTTVWRFEQFLVSFILDRFQTK